MWLAVCLLQHHGETVAQRDLSVHHGQRTDRYQPVFPQIQAAGLHIQHDATCGQQRLMQIRDRQRFPGIQALLLMFTQLRLFAQPACPPSEHGSFPSLVRVLLGLCQFRPAFPWLRIA